MGKKSDRKVKYKVLTPENLEEITAKKQEQGNTKTPRQVKNGASCSKSKVSEAQSLGNGSNSTSSTSKETSNAEVKVNKDINNEKSQQANEKSQQANEKSQQATGVNGNPNRPHNFTDNKPNARQQVIAENDDKADVVDSAVSGHILSSSAQEITRKLEETTLTSKPIAEELNIDKALEDTPPAEVLNSASANMDPTPKNLQVSKPLPDNPAWISNTCSPPPTSRHPFSSLNPDATEFKPGNFAALDHTQLNITYPLENLNVRPPFVIPKVNEIFPHPVMHPASPGTILQNAPAPFGPHNVPRPVPIHPVQEETLNMVCGSMPPESFKSVVPDHYNSTDTWHSEQMRASQYPQHQNIEEVVVQSGQGTDYNITESVPPQVHTVMATYTEQTIQGPTSSTADTYLEENWDPVTQPNVPIAPPIPEVGPKDTSGNWSDEDYSEPTYPAPDDRKTESSSNYLHKDNYRSQNYQGAKDNRGGRRWRSGEHQYSRHDERHGHSATARGSDSRPKENWDRDQSEKSRHSDDGQKEAQERVERSDNRGEAWADNSRNASDYHNNRRGMGQRQNNYRGSNRGYENRSYNNNNRGQTRPFQRNQNRDVFDRKQDPSFRDENAKQNFGDHGRDSSTHQDQRNEVDNSSWRSRDNDKSNRSFTKNRDDGNRDSNRSYNNQKYNNQSGNFKGGSDARFRNSDRGGRGRSSERGGYNSRQNYHNENDVRQSPVDAEERVNDDSSKGSSDNYRRADEAARDVPEENADLVKTSCEEAWGKSNVSEEADPAWNGDWNTSVDDSLEKSSWDTEGEVSAEESRNQSFVDSIPEEKEASDMPKRPIKRDEVSWVPPPYRPEPEKMRRSLDIPKGRDPKMERDKLRKSLDSALDSNQSTRNRSGPRYQEADRDKSDQEFDRWESSWHKIKEFQVVSEKQGNLFEQPKEFSLAHCVAEDLRMGSGIAVDFKREFKNLPDLLDQRARQGGLATLHDAPNNRFVYYLVTKKESAGKPTYQTLWRSLSKMRDHIKENKVKKLAIPRLACGLDRLEWNKVKSMIEYLFGDDDVDITVCNFQQDEEVPKKSVTCKLVVEEYPVTKIAYGTLIFYFTTTNGDVDENMLDLSKKFNFLPAFKSHKSKNLGEIVYSEDKGYGLCGCVVRNRNKDEISFKSLSRCVQEFNKKNRSFRTDAYEYVAYQWVNDTDYFDYLINEKIITVLINQLRNVHVYVCKGRSEGNGD